ncbi:conserved hypothetical protein [Ricinus communis]|uniref:Uncharacterized protein n=1 Tax=Ricinus communis TaxID=3988 RepID=B9T0M8_RICCO|nr:conserved hypothetical protein [Ricinus communis]
MEADLEPGLAWMVIATEEGEINRIHDGKLLFSVSDGFELAVLLAFDFPFFAGAIQSIAWLFF